MENINKIKVIKENIKKNNSLINGMYKNTSYTETKNGATTFLRSGSPLLDFFAQAGAMRNEEEKALDLFKKAFSEDKEKAIRVLFYLRDVRGGQGERKLFRNCLEYLGNNDEKVFEQIIDFIPEFGRWDDMFFDNKNCFELIKNQLNIDLKSDTPSLLAKWLPTINASSQSTRAKARVFVDNLGMTEIGYRKTIRSLRKKIKTVEEKMSANKWEEIEYSTVPSRASMIYRTAFKKHDEDRYQKFIDKAEKGEVKINASTLYPYELYKKINTGNEENTINALWKQLPDYNQGKNALVVADVSGSMRGDPMSVSVSLALYFAERNNGNFKDYFITFTETPTLQKINGTTLKEKMNSIERSRWGMNTDIQSVFDLILNTGIENNVPQNEMPETIYIISDMEFDNATSNYYAKTETNYDIIKEKYENAGYKKPNLVFWNVNASGTNLPVEKDENNVSMVSGFSPSIFKIAVENKTPEQVMLDTINNERYSIIKID